ncbi:hypothetical protein TD95_004422 [Thielaviopsis punctulata]|uniref:AGC-kinase C-terminal domain-containing protein n=1 Tax=Thielaviopsis punctulata TaxID=72032 RepID=A0A0F4ZEU9_9PEZI|nr:hypothetical protein TD95_004422 [Thielaviopsis punctulata]
MLSHLRFHRRGASNPTSPTPISADGQSAASHPQARLQGNNAQALSQSQSSHLKPRASRSRSPLRSKTKSLLLSPSNFGGNSTSFDAADFKLSPLAQASDGDDKRTAKPHRASLAVPPSALSSSDQNLDPVNSGFIGGLALRNYQNRRQQAASSVPVAEPGAAPPAANTNNTTSITTQPLGPVSPPHPQAKLPPPPINTNLTIPGGRYSLPAQPSPGFGISPASSSLSPHHGKSPSFVTPTDMKSHQEMQQQLFAAAASNGSSTASGSKGKQKQTSSQQPHKKTKGMTFLRPVSTLLQRRKANNSVPDMRALRDTTDELMFDPRIKGNKVHDFSAPRPKKPPTATTPVVTEPTPTTDTVPETLSGTGLMPKLPMSTSTTALVGAESSTTLLQKDATSLPASLRSVPSTASAKITKSDNAKDGDVFAATPTVNGSVKSRRSRKISISEMSLRSSISRRMKSTSSRFSFDFMGADNQEKDLENKYRRRYPNKVEPKAPEQTNSFAQGDDRFDGLDMDDFDYDAMMEDDGLEEEIPGLNLDYNEDDILEEEEEDPFEYDEAYKDNYEAEDDDVPHVGLGHMTLEDIEAADAPRNTAVSVTGHIPQTGSDEVTVIETHIPEQSETAEPGTTKHESIEALSQAQTEHAVQDVQHNQLLSISALATISESDAEPTSDVVEHVVETCLQSGDVTSADSQNFAAFKFSRSNPASELTSPLSAGLQSTPRDPEGRVIGFAVSKDTPTTSSNFLPMLADQDRSPGLCIRMNSPLSSTGEPEPEAIPLEMQEQFQMRAPAYERLGALVEEEKQFDAGVGNEFAEEFVTDEFTKGDDAGFDEALFDLDDTDQYGRPIPGAFASAQQKLMEARKKQMTEGEAEEVKETKGVSHEASREVSKETQEPTQTTTSPEMSQDTPKNTAEKGSSGPTIPEPIMIPTFIPIHQAEAAKPDANEVVSIPPPDMANGAEICGIGPETSPEHSRAYQAALLAATQKAFEDGKFKRESWASEALPEDEPVEDNGLAGYEDEDDGADYGYDDDIGGGFNMADYENDDMDDYYDLGDEDDRKIIEEANATALANDCDGWYGQEFGFYSAPLSQHHQLNNAVKYEYSNGGFFGPAGMTNVSRTGSGRVAVREPNLTPITERSEYSNRNSIMSLPGITLPPSALTSPGLAQLAMMSDHEDSNMSLGALLRLRSKAWGGSQASSHQGSPRSERAEAMLSPMAPLWGGMTSPMSGLRSDTAADEVAADGPLSAPLAGPTGFSSLAAGLHGGSSLSAQTSPAMASAAQFQSLISASGFPPPREFPLTSKTGGTGAGNGAGAGAGAGAGSGTGTGGGLPDLEEEEETEGKA